MTIDEKIAVLEAARTVIEGKIVDAARIMADAGKYPEGELHVGSIAEAWADHGALGDLTYTLAERFEDELRGAGKAERAEAA